MFLLLLLCICFAIGSNINPLDSILSRINYNNTVIFTSFAAPPADLTTLFDEREYLSWLRHFVAQLKVANRLQNTLIVVQDDRECDVFMNVVSCFVDREVWTKEILEKNKDLGLYGISVLVKWKYSQLIVDLGYNAIFLDTDIALMKDPLLLLDSSYDIMGLSDLLETREPCHNHVGPCQSTGVMVFKSSLQSSLFLSKMTARLHEEPEKWEQDLLNRMMLTEQHRLRYRLLSDNVAANCRVFRHHALVDLNRAKQDLIVMHLGWVPRGDAKVRIFRQYGVFLGDVEFTAQRLSVDSGVNLLLQEYQNYPTNLCKPEPSGIWCFPM